MKLTITFVINGKDVEVDVNSNEPLQAARNEALAKSKNTGRPPDEWVIRDEGGQTLDPKMKVSDLAGRTRLFLNVNVGAGGAN